MCAACEIERLQLVVSAVTLVRTVVSYYVCTMTVLQSFDPFAEVLSVFLDSKQRRSIISTAIVSHSTPAGHDAWFRLVSSA